MQWNAVLRSLAITSALGALCVADEPNTPRTSPTLRVSWVGTVRDEFDRPVPSASVFVVAEYSGRQPSLRKGAQLDFIFELARCFFSLRLTLLTAEDAETRGGEMKRGHRTPLRSSASSAVNTFAHLNPPLRGHRNRWGRTGQTT